MKRLCVFCGSSSGARPEYVEAAGQLGRLLAARGIALVYGGARVGMMGHIARAALAADGDVIGVIPSDLADAGVAFADLPDLRLVGSMHERKALMAELADGFIALPGGFGTLEEFFEALTWMQLGKHAKPCGLLNVCHYYDRLMDFLDVAREQQFIDTPHRAVVLIDESADVLLKKLDAFQAPKVNKAEWILHHEAQDRP